MIRIGCRRHARASWIAIAIALVTAVSCARDAGPARLDPANTACAFCRMAVSDVHFAAQITAPGVEPVFFDDIGCLRNHLAKSGSSLPAGAVAFVADHRTGAWVRAADAVFTRPSGLGTPMGGGLIAHVSEDSKRLDRDTASGVAVPISELFGAAGPPDGSRR